MKRKLWTSVQAVAFTIGGVLLGCTLVCLFFVGLAFVLGGGLSL